MRNYKSKNIHTKPSLAGLHNLPEGYADNPRRKLKMAKENGAEIFGLYQESTSSTGRFKERESAWTGEEMVKYISDYFEYCFEKGIKPSKAGMRLVLHVSDAQMHDWYTKPEKYGDISNAIRDAFSLLEFDYIDSSESYPTSNVFLLKSSFGHRDRMDVDVTTTSKEVSADEISGIVSKLGLDKE